MTEPLRRFCQLINAAILRFSERGASEGASSIAADLVGRFVCLALPAADDDMRPALADAECLLSIPSLLHLSPAPRFAVAAFAMVGVGAIDRCYDMVLHEYEFLYLARESVSVRVFELLLFCGVCLLASCLWILCLESKTILSPTYS